MDLFKVTKIRYLDFQYHHLLLEINLKNDY